MRGSVEISKMGRVLLGKHSTEHHTKPSTHFPLQSHHPLIPLPTRQPPSIQHSNQTETKEAMPSKACDEYTDCKRQRLYRRLFALLLAVIIAVLLATLIIWLVLRPTKPRFYLRDVTVSQLNLTAPSALSANLQVTLSSLNPNDLVGVYYDKLDAYAVYSDQRVTVPTSLPSGYQGHHDFSLWSPFLYGTDIPVSDYLTSSFAQDEHAGFLLIDVRVDGKLRWKVGSWVSGHYHVHVNCPAFLTVGDGKGDGGGGTGFKFQRMVTCHVDV